MKVGDKVSEKDFPVRHVGTIVEIKGNKAYVKWSKVFYLAGAICPRWTATWVDLDKLTEVR